MPATARTRRHPDAGLAGADPRSAGHAAGVAPMLEVQAFVARFIGGL
ncbi:hypothetical protein PATSB16_24580 [Pandoraea thiooxydans]|nr:hypothetical protein PATSB16_24580 [Pandoraea thiooxydans]